MKIQNGSFAAAMNAVAGAAKDTDYDNTTSGLEADKVQSAIDTLLERIKVLENRKQSHIGMIVQSSKLDTMEKVISEYGGTTWEKIEGRFLLGQSSSYAINSTGGEATHKLTTSEIPSHTHGCSGTILTYASGGGIAVSSGNNVKGVSLTTNATGGGSAHNNMPPYKVIYIWERTA